jgi:hypothetical protein
VSGIAWDGDEGRDANEVILAGFEGLKHPYKQNLIRIGELPQVQKTLKEPTVAAKATPTTTSPPQ